MVAWTKIYHLAAPAKCMYSHEKVHLQLVDFVTFEVARHCAGICD